MPQVKYTGAQVNANQPPGMHTVLPYLMIAIHQLRQKYSHNV